MGTAQLVPDDAAQLVMHRERPRSAILFCYFCGGALSGWLPLPPGTGPGGTTDTITRRCPNGNCAKATPACAVCLLPIFVIRSGKEGEAVAKQSPGLEVDNWAAWC